MPADTQNKELKNLTNQQYKYGFTTHVESESLPPGLNEDTVRWISAKKNEPEFMLNYRLKAFEQWKKMKEPTWAHIQYPKIDYQSISYFSALGTSHPAPKRHLRRVQPSKPSDFGAKKSQNHPL